MPRLGLAAVALAATALSAALASAAAGGSLKVTATGPATIGVGVPAKVQLRIRNSGRASVSGVRVSVRVPKGLTATPARARLARLARGASRTVSVAVVQNALSSSTSPARLTVTATAAHARLGRATLVLPQGLAGRYLWRADPFNNIQFTGYYFVDDRWAYRGAPTGGLPTSCTTAVGTDSDGCVRYTLDRKTGVLNVGGIAGTAKRNAQDVQINQQFYEEVGIPAKGGRFNEPYASLSSSGCPLACKFLSASLQLGGDGQFARSDAVTGDVVNGSIYAVVPPDQHGTYAVGDHGQLTLTYADRTVKTQTFGILSPSANTPNPDYAALLDGTLYTGPKFDSAGK